MDTYVAARLWIDNDRWRGVPFLLRTGKRLAQGQQRVSIILREPTGTLVDLPKHGNVLSFELKGGGDIDLRLVAKKPGAELEFDAAGVTLKLAPARRRRPAAALRPADPRRAARRPVAVHPPGRAGRRVGRGRAAAEPARPALPYVQGSWGPAGRASLPRPTGGCSAGERAPGVGFWETDRVLRWITAGESHGPALVAILDGLPAGVEVTTDGPRPRSRPPAARLRPGRADDIRAGRGRADRRRPARRHDGRAGSGAHRQHRVAEVGDGDGGRSGRRGRARRAGTQRAIDPAAAGSRRSGGHAEIRPRRRPAGAGAGQRARDGSAGRSRRRRQGLPRVRRSARAAQPRCRHRLGAVPPGVLPGRATGPPSTSSGALRRRRDRARR